MSAMVSRHRLAAVLGMLGSEHDGEALNAARLAERLRKSAGVSWSDLLQPGASLPERPLPPPPPRRPHWSDMVIECWQRPEALTDWERKFVASVAQRASLSPKQWAILADIAKKARAA